MKLAIKNLFITLLFMAALNFTCCNKKNNEDPLDLGSICDGGLYIYRYDSEKEFIGDFLMGDWLFVAFNLQAQDFEIVTLVNDAGFFEPIDATKVIRPKTSHPYLFVNIKEQRTCLQLVEVIRALQKEPIVDRADLVFGRNINPNGYILNLSAYTGRIRIFVKDEDDLSDLYAEIKKTDTWIIEELANPLLPKMFYLGVNKNSKGNTLQVANYLSETEKFEYVQTGSVSLDVLYRDPFPEYSLFGTGCQWVNPYPWTNSVVIINSYEELEKHISCSNDSNYPEVDFSKHTLLMAKGAASGAGTYVDAIHSQTGEKEHLLEVTVYCGGHDALTPWAIGILIPKITNYENIILKVNEIPFYANQ